MRIVLLVLFIFSLTFETGNAQLFHKNALKKADKSLFGKTINHKKGVKGKEPRKVGKARRKQEANKRKLDSDYDKAVVRSQKRTIQIQTPDVQTRMKQNQKDIIVRDKAKKKRVKSSTKKAGKKYK